MTKQVAATLLFSLINGAETKLCSVFKESFCRQKTTYNLEIVDNYHGYSVKEPFGSRIQLFKMNDVFFQYSFY